MQIEGRRAAFATCWDVNLCLAMPQEQESPETDWDFRALECFLLWVELVADVLREPRLTGAKPIKVKAGHFHSSCWLITYPMINTALWAVNLPLSFKSPHFDGRVRLERVARL
jgi:hypothetical protein